MVARCQCHVLMGTDDFNDSSLLMVSYTPTWLIRSIVLFNLLGNLRLS